MIATASVPRENPVPFAAVPSPLLTPHIRAQLSPQQADFLDEVLTHYRAGWFPMNDPDTGRTEWVQARRRGIIPLQPDTFHVPGTLKARIKSGRFRIETDTAFSAVIRACATPAAGRKDTWIDPLIIETFDLLHRIGLAHCVEAWLDEPGTPDTQPTPRLVGGLYGLALGKIFCGESMFSLPDEGGTDASKVCLVNLVEHLQMRGFCALDAQLSNPHLAQFGMYEIGRHAYQRWLDQWADTPLEWLPWKR